MRWSEIIYLFIFLPVLFSLTGVSIKGFSPHLMIPNTSTNYKSVTLSSALQSKYANGTSILVNLIIYSEVLVRRFLPVVLSPL